MGTTLWINVALCAGAGLMIVAFMCAIRLRLIGRLMLFGVLAGSIITAGLMAGAINTPFQYQLPETINWSGVVWMAMAIAAISVATKYHHKYPHKCYGDCEHHAPRVSRVAARPRAFARH